MPKNILNIYPLIEKKKNTPTAKFITTRFGNVLGSYSFVVPLFMKQIQNRAYITITLPDINLYFMTIPDAFQLAFEARAIGNMEVKFLFLIWDSLLKLLILLEK